MFDAAESALDVADIAGRVSLDWQQLVVRSGMAQRDDGAWAAFEVGVLVSRQNGKNGAIEVVELGWMVNEPGVSILHTAHEFQTAQESMEKLEALIRANPWTEALIAKNGVRRGNGKESIRFRCDGGCGDSCPDLRGAGSREECRKGSMIRFRTRTKSGGRGFSVDRLVVDEAMIYSPASQAAITPLMTTAKRPQIWYLGSAADEESHEYCHKWSSLRERALAGGDPSLTWLEWSAPDPPKDEGEREVWRMSRENWAMSNPSLGTLVTEEYIEDELRSFRGRLEKWEIERLSAGRWPNPDLGDPYIDSDLWAAMAKGNAVPVGHIALGVAMSDDRKWVTIAAAQRTADGRIHLEVGYHEAPSRAVIDRVMRLITSWDPCCLALRGGTAPEMSLSTDLLAHGIEPETTSGPQFAQACGGFYDDAVNGLLSHTDDPRLASALAGAHAKENGGVPDAPAGAVISPLQAAVLARWGLLTFGIVTAPASPALPNATRTADADEFDPMSVAF